MTNATERTRIDLATLIAIGVIAYALSNVTHEGLGHGGACILAGGKAVELNAVYFQCDESMLSPAGLRWLAAGGTLANVALAAVLAVVFRKRAATPLAYFAWLVESICLFQASGYLFFSGVMDIGDWAEVIRGAEPAFAYRALMAVVGAGLACVAVDGALHRMTSLLGPSEGRLARAAKLMRVPYLAGGALYLAAGALNPSSPMLILISAAAASFGGTSELAWMHNFLRNERRYPPCPDSELVLARSIPLVALAAAIAVGFVVVLGRSIHF